MRYHRCPTVAVPQSLSFNSYYFVRRAHSRRTKDDTAGCVMPFTQESSEAGPAKGLQVSPHLSSHLARQASAWYAREAPLPAGAIIKA